MKDCQENLIVGLLKAMEFQCVKSKEVLDKESDVKSLKAEVERQLKLLNGLVYNSVILSLKTELERQLILIDGLVKEPERKPSLTYNTINNCTQAKSNGIYETLVPTFSNTPFKVVCDTQTREGGWTIILRRLDGSVDFYRNWTEYKNGFGNLDGEFFLGLDKIHALTTESKQELLFVLEDFKGDERYETYTEFAIGNEAQLYAMHTLGSGSGTAGDSFKYHRLMNFSTMDRDNDLYKDNCAKEYSGAWWYNGCHYSNLAGKYNLNKSGGVIWHGFRGADTSLKRAVMMIRPKK